MSTEEKSPTPVTTETPVQVTETPETPVQVTQVTETPVQVTETPVQVTETPVQVTETPVTLNTYIDNNKAPEKVAEKPPKKPPKVEQPKESDQLKEQLKVVTDIAKTNLIKAANIHPDLVDLLPTDLGKLSAYLESEAFKKANSALHKASTLETKPVTQTPAQTPPKAPSNETSKPKTFDDVSPEAKAKMTSLLRGFI